jgi:hypothetical protein
MKYKTPKNDPSNLEFYEVRFPQLPTSECVKLKNRFIKNYKNKK